MESPSSEAGNLKLHCWSHRKSDSQHHFDLLDSLVGRHCLNLSLHMSFF